MISMTDQPTVASSSCLSPLRSMTLSFGMSGNTQFLLQVRARGRVAEDQLLFGKADLERLLAHQRRLVESGQDQLELAGIGADVANGENPGLVGGELGRVDRDQVAIEVEPPLGDRA